MASIQKLTGKNGDSYKAQIRCKGHKHKSQCFDDYETAYIWVKYYEMIYKEKDDFAARDNDLLMVIDVMVFKHKDASHPEYTECIGPFTRLGMWEVPISSLTHEVLMEHAKTLLNTPIYKGYRPDQLDGPRKLPSANTVMRKFAYLSSAINHMIKQGFDLDNNMSKIIAYLRNLDKKQKMTS